MDKRQETTMGGGAVTLLGTTPKVGDKAPAFHAVKKDLTPFELREVLGKEIVIISAVPSVDTPVCELQTKRFNEEADKIDGVKILTISMDLPFALDKFCSAFGIKSIELLSDSKDRSFGMNYGVFIEELGLLNRSLFVIDKEGVIRYLEVVKENTNHPDYDACLEAVRELAK